MPGDGQRNSYSRRGRGKLESQPLCDISVQHKFETKNARPFKLMQLETFQGDQRNFFSGMKVKVFFKKLGRFYKRFNKPKYSQGLFFRVCGDKAPISTKSNQVQQGLVPPEMKDLLEKDTIREASHCKDSFFSHLFLVSKKDGG